MSKLLPFLDLFVGYLHAERGLAVRTVEAYAADLAEYLGGLDAAGVQAPDGIRAVHVRGHLDVLAGSAGSPRGGAGPGTLLPFESFIASSSPRLTRRSTPRPTWRRLARPVAFRWCSASRSVEALLDAPCPDGCPPGMRDRAMLALLYATGLRVSELVSLPVEALRLDAGFLVTRGQGQQGASGAGGQPGPRGGADLPRPGPLCRC